jgi:hypothetical protein
MEVGPTAHYTMGGIKIDPETPQTHIKGLFTAIDMSAFATVQLAIEDKDSAAFVTAYKQTLEAWQHRGLRRHKSLNAPLASPAVGRRHDGADDEGKQHRGNDELFTRSQRRGCRDAVASANTVRSRPPDRRERGRRRPRGASGR